MTGCHFKNEGLVILFNTILSQSQLFSKLDFLQLNANYIDDLIFPEVKKFIENYPQEKPMTIELKKQNFFGKKLALFRE